MAEILSRGIKLHWVRACRSVLSERRIDMRHVQIQEMKSMSMGLRTPTGPGGVWRCCCPRCSWGRQATHAARRPLEGWQLASRLLQLQGVCQFLTAAAVLRPGGLTERRMSLDVQWNYHKR